MLHGKRIADFPFWLLTSRSMQYSWGANVSLPILADVARHVKGHFGVMLNRGAAVRLGIRDGDLVSLDVAHRQDRGSRSCGKASGRCRDPAAHWATPFARDLGMPNSIRWQAWTTLTDATGSGPTQFVTVRRAS